LFPQAQHISRAAGISDRYFFVEPLLTGHYRKWNTNFGSVNYRPTLSNAGAGANAGAMGSGMSSPGRGSSSFGAEAPSGGNPSVGVSAGAGLGEIMEGDEEDEDEDEEVMLAAAMARMAAEEEEDEVFMQSNEVEDGFVTIGAPTIDDVPQAFSHWCVCLKPRIARRRRLA